MSQTPASESSADPEGEGPSAVPLGESSGMRSLRHNIAQVAETNATVLIRGESGVGKEVVAKSIHHSSPRARYPFVKVNCAALPAELLESELFGHEKGAFTGAYRRKAGTFELADGGTIFLDEIGDMPIALQAKLLHVLQDHEFTRVGGRDLIKVDVRVIASTNRNLETAMRAGRFREDLYYRLKVVTLYVPPLRDRREEIPGLTARFLHLFNTQFHRDIALNPESLRLLMDYAWPGNVRELENMIKRVVVLRNERLLNEELTAAMDAMPPPSRSSRRPELAKASTLRDVVRHAALSAQRQALLEVLERVHWNRAEAARRLGISYKSLLYKIDQSGLARKRAPQRAEGDEPRS
jgi:two-component system, NtrC family, response regulator AtoC